ncbi:MAG: hypothetical protein JXQ73_21010 [Phycisphaerae bacterium]|nr:hypothetical protein [Phycisphaerae bacterium]
MNSRSCGVLAVLAMVTSTASAQITFTKVADGSTIAPGQGVCFTGFYPPSIDDGEVAFFGLAGGWQGGIYTTLGGSLMCVADANTPIPGSANSFYWLRYEPKIGGGKVAFVGHDENNVVRGVYAYEGGSLRVVADNNTPIPGGTGSFDWFFDYISVSEDGDVSFYGNGLYKEVGGTLSLVADSATPAPGGTGTLMNYPMISSINSGNVAFFDVDAAKVHGVYAELGGTLTLIASQNTPIPGATGTFYLFDLPGETLGPSIDGNDVAFLAVHADSRDGIYLHSGGSLGVVADTETPCPDKAGNFSSFVFASPSVDEGNVAFRGTYDGGHGICVSWGGAIIPVIATGDALDGKTVRGLDIGHRCLDGNQIVFRVNFVTNDEAAIYIATLPSTVHTLDLDVTNEGWGSVEGLNNPPVYFAGTEVTLTAVPADGRSFKHWEIYDPNYPDDLNYATLETSPEITIVMDTDRSVTAVFGCGTGAAPMLPLALCALTALVISRRGT